MLCSFLYRAVCLRTSFNKEIEENWKMIIMLRSVEGQASGTDERYLFNNVEGLDPTERDVNSICLE